MYKHIDETWSIDLADMVDYRTSNNKGFKNIIVIKHKFSKYLLAKPPKNKYSQIITNECSKHLATSKRKPLKIESDRCTEFFNIIFQKFLKTKSIHHYSRFTDEGPSIAERVIRTIGNLLKKKTIFLVGKASWIDELTSVTKKNNITNHHSIKMTPVQATIKSNEKLVHSNLMDDREKQTPKYKLGQFVRTADIKKVFSKGDSTNYSYHLYTITEVIHDTIPSF